MCNVGPTSYLQDSLLFGLQRVLKLDIFCENLWTFNLKPISRQKLVRQNDRDVCFFASFMLFERFEVPSPQMDFYFAVITTPPVGGRQCKHNIFRRTKTIYAQSLLTVCFFQSLNLNSGGQPLANVAFA